MAGEAREAAHVARYELGRAVVVVEDGDDAVVERVVGLAEADVDGDEGLDEEIEDAVDGC